MKSSSYRKPMRTFNNVKWMASIWLGFGLLTAPSAWADSSYQIQPAAINLNPVGSGASASFQVISTGNEPVAVEIHMTDRQVDDYGTETNSDAEDNFAIYPPQILLQPGESQTVRITWLGEPNPDHELAYRVITEQLPVQLTAPPSDATAYNTAITVLFRYIASVYIIPENAASNIVLESASHRNENGQDQLVLVFNNQGTAHQLLSDLNLTLSSLAVGGQGQADSTIRLGAEQLQGVAGENILAQHQRQFIIPWPANLPVGPVSADFTINH